MKSGDIFWSSDVVTVSPTGEIQHKQRPVLVLSNVAALKNSGIAQVIPISSQIQKQNRIPSHVLIGEGTSLNKPSILLPEQICTVSQKSFGDYLGNVGETALKIIQKSVQMQLGIL